jgi:hypothetical protein
METLKHGNYLCLVINGQVEMFSLTSELVWNCSTRKVTPKAEAGSWCKQDKVFQKCYFIIHTDGTEIVYIESLLHKRATCEKIWGYRSGKYKACGLMTYDAVW